MPGIDPNTGQSLLVNIDTPATGPEFKTQMDWMRQQFDKLGIQLVVRATTWPRFQKKIAEGNVQIYFGSGWMADYPDPENFLDILFHTGSDNNQTNYSNIEVDALLEQARIESNQTQRFEMYNRIEQMILDDAPWVPLWNSGENYALVKPEVKGYYLTAMTIPKYRHVYMVN